MYKCEVHKTGTYYLEIEMFLAVIVYDTMANSVRTIENDKHLLCYLEYYRLLCELMFDQDRQVEQVYDLPVNEPCQLVLVFVQVFWLLLIQVRNEP